MSPRRSGPWSAGGTRWRIAAGLLALASCAALGDLVVMDAARPIGVLVAPAGGPAYVACNARSEIAVVDLWSGRVLRRPPVGEGPDGLAWSRIG